VGAQAFQEVWVSTSLAVCEQRDVKGLYKKARSGELASFTGISDPYEAPRAPILALDTHMLSVADCLAQLNKLIELEGSWE
jgi:adenylylsulfate kinase